MASDGGLGRSRPDGRRHRGEGRARRAGDFVALFYVLAAVFTALTPYAVWAPATRTSAGRGDGVVVLTVIAGAAIMEVLLALIALGRRRA